MAKLATRSRGNSSSLRGNKLFSCMMNGTIFEANLFILSRKVFMLSRRKVGQFFPQWKTFLPFWMSRPISSFPSSCCNVSLSKELSAFVLHRTRVLCCSFFAKKVRTTLLMWEYTQYFMMQCFCSVFFVGAWRMALTFLSVFLFRWTIEKLNCSKMRREKERQNRTTKKIRLWPHFWGKL